MGVGTTRGVISSRRAVEQLQAPDGLQTECGIKSSYNLHVDNSGFDSIPLVPSKKKESVLTVCQRFAEQRRIYLLRTVFVEGAAIFHHSFIRNKTFHSGHSYVPETQRGANLTRVQIDAVNKMRARGKHDYDPGDSVLAVNFSANHRCFDICMCHIIFTVHVFI